MPNRPSVARRLVLLVQRLARWLFRAKAPRFIAPRLTFGGHSVRELEEWLLGADKKRWTSLGPRQLAVDVATYPRLADAARTFAGVNDALRRSTDAQLALSVRVRAQEARAALAFVIRFVALDDASIARRIWTDVGAAAVAYRLACRHVLAWTTAGAPSAQSRTKDALARAGEDRSGADLLAMHGGLADVIDLLADARLLKQHLSAPDRDRQAATTQLPLTDVVLMRFVARHLRGADPANAAEHGVPPVIRAWSRVTRAHAIRGRGLRSDEIIGYEWFVLAEGEEVPLPVVARALQEHPVSDEAMLAELATLVAANPLDLLFHAGSTQSPIEAKDWAHVARTVSGRAPASILPVMKGAYWVLHDVMADWLAAALVAAAKRPARAPAAADAVAPLIDEVVEVATRHEDDERTWGARHFLCACLDHLWQRPAWQHIAGDEAAARSVRAILSGIHRLRVDDAHRPGAGGDAGQAFRKRFGRWLPASGENEDSVRFADACRAWLGALVIERPRALVSRPGAAAADSGDTAAPDAERPILLHRYTRINPGAALAAVLTAEEWQPTGDGSFETTDNGVTLAIDVTRMTFRFAPPSQRDAAWRAILWVCFRSYADALAATLDGTPSLNREVGTISVFGTRPDGTSIRAAFDVHVRSWSLEPRGCLT